MIDDPPSHLRLPRQLWAWITAAAIIVPLGFVVLIHAMMASSAEAKWAAVQKRLADTHHTLDYSALVPQPVPDDDNFFAIPALKNIAVVESKDEPAGAATERRERLQTLKMDPPPRKGQPESPSGMDYGLRWDAAAWAKYYRDNKILPMTPTSDNPGRDILQGMATMQPLLDKLKAGIGRKISQITPAWTERPPLPGLLMGIPVPYLNPLQETGRTLFYHARAAAAAGDSATAIDDVCTLLRFVEGLGREPTVIHSLVAITILHMVAEPPWSALDRRPADEAALARLAQCLEHVDLRAMLTTGMRGEMAVHAQACDVLMTASASELLNPGRLGLPSDPMQRISHILSYTLITMNAPAAAKGNKAVLADLMLTHFIEPLETGGLAALYKSSSKITTSDDVEKLVPGVFGFMARMTLPSYHGIVERALMLDARVAQMRLACALERHFIKHQSYPDHLNSLVPQFLPTIPTIPADPIDGQPMRYQKTGARYKLWSLGFDNDDDGGVVKSSAKDDPEYPKLKAADYPGDWVWSYERLVPEPSPEPAPTPAHRRVVLPPAAPLK